MPPALLCRPTILPAAGAGKSSLSNVLLRLRPLESGTLLIQGRDAAQLPLRVLRGSFGVVPQQPLLFAGSLRDNLDPWGRASDEQLAATLQVCVCVCRGWVMFVCVNGG
jgi:ABC-type multidrug transport system fused ATPase/permease subunit